MRNLHKYLVYEGLHDILNLHCGANNINIYVIPWEIYEKLLNMSGFNYYIILGKIIFNAEIDKKIIENAEFFAKIIEKFEDNIELICASNDYKHLKLQVAAILKEIGGPA